MESNAWNVHTCFSQPRQLDALFGKAKYYEALDLYNEAMEGENFVVNCITGILLTKYTLTFPQPINRSESHGGQHSQLHTSFGGKD